MILSSISNCLLIIFRYGSPGSLKVTEEYNVGWGHYLSSGHGVIIAYVDGRGTGDFEFHLNCLLFILRYGSPGSQKVTEEYNVGWEHYLSSVHGVIIAYVDGRGTGDFEFYFKLPFIYL